MKSPGQIDAEILLELSRKRGLGPEYAPLVLKRLVRDGFARTSGVVTAAGVRVIRKHAEQATLGKHVES